MCFWWSGESAFSDVPTPQRGTNRRRHAAFRPPDGGFCLQVSSDDRRAGDRRTVGLVGYIVGLKSWPLFAYRMAWIVSVALSIIPLLARAYSHFDPSLEYAV